MEKPHHWACHGRDRKNRDQNIYLSYCREHDDILIQYEGTLILYQDHPPPPAPTPAPVQEVVSHSSPFQTICQWIVALISILIVLPFLLNAPPSLPNNTTTTLSSTQARSSWGLRTSYYSLQHENMRPMSASIQTTTLHNIIDMIVGTLSHMDAPRPPCLCHHHLDHNASMYGGIYAPVCVIPLGQNYWQPIVNPKPMSMDELYQYHSDVVITRFQVDESHSFVLKPEKRYRYNTIGIYSQWPALNYAPYYQHQPLRQNWIVYDELAQCMALAMDEIRVLLDYK